MLPHLHSEDDVDKLFPLLRASPPGENVEDWQPSEECEGRVDGRPGSASRVLDRREGRTSVAPSRGRPLVRPSAARRHEVQGEHEKIGHLVAVDDEHEDSAL